MDNVFALNNIKAEESQTIKGSMTIGANIDQDKYLKKQQVLKVCNPKEGMPKDETNTNIVFLGDLVATEVEIAKHMIDTVLRPLRRDLTKKDPTNMTYTVGTRT